jgi:hypothetical protein
MVAMHHTRRSSGTRGSDWRYGRVCKHRRAGDGVSIYTSKKSTEYEEMRKGKKRRMKDGGETHR